LNIYLAKAAKTPYIYQTTPTINSLWEAKKIDGKSGQCYWRAPRLKVYCEAPFFLHLPNHPHNQQLVGGEEY